MHILSLTRVVDIAYTLLLFSCLKLSFAVDSISQFQTLTDGMTLVSSDGTFEFGFFSPAGNTNRRYLGIWFKNIPVQTVVWVANRVNPTNDSKGILTLDNNGNLVLTHNNTLVWDIAISLRKQARKNPLAQLLNSGNLVVREENNDAEDEEAYLWQSFDYPTDTMLAGMKFGWDLRINLNRQFTAWKSPDDPAPGDFSWSVVLHNYPELCMMKGTKVFHRTGPWNGLYFSGYPRTNPNLVYKSVSNENEIYYQWSLENSSVISMLVLNQTTYNRHRYFWMGHNWLIFNTLPEDYCDAYDQCGAYGNCVITESPVCQCLKGFKPKSPQQWNSMNWSQGCVHEKPLNCKQKLKDGFVKFVGLKVPDTSHTWVDKTIGLEECGKKCLNNCSCMAYTNSDISGKGSGCVMWFGDLVDIRQFQVSGQDLYIRMDASEIAAEHGRKKKLTTIVASTIASILGLLLLGCYCIYKVQRKMKIENPDAENNNDSHEDDSDLPLLDLSTIVTATDNFSVKNKVGEGGFGPVYRGRLVNGQEIAVKQLSTSSRQGISEFRNEVRLIAKLQHRNLVKLLGCCNQGQQNILVYEYMPNNSLDSFIFDSTKGKLLDWSKRFHIICGIGKGLLYLHQDSRLRIIHRDLKASNVLLDDKLNPKISDFGMAKFFGGDQTEGNTNKVVGTYGYMAPEYAIDGLFSVKSDVFSFGILLMEIISGKKNRRSYQADDSLNLIGHAWKLWKDGKATELMHSNLKESCTISEALRCIHVGLLCVQQHPEDRPSMSSVVLMLGSEMKLAEPKEPGFFPKHVSAEMNSSSSQRQTGSANEITCTSSIHGR